MLKSMVDQIKKGAYFMSNNVKFDQEQFTQDVLEFISKHGDTVDQAYVQELLYLFHKYFHDSGGISTFSIYLKDGEIYNASTNYDQVPGRTEENWNLEVKDSLAEIASRPENKGTIFLIPKVYAENENFIPPENIELNRTFILNEETITTRLSISSKEEALKYSKEKMIMDPDPNGIDMSLIRKNNPIDLNGNRPFISSALVTSIWKGDEFIGLLMAGYRSINCFSGSGYLTPTDTLKVKALTDLIAAGLKG